jgi:hypothetical protein
MDLIEFGRMFDCSVSDILDKLRNGKNDFWRWWWSQFASEQVGIHHAHLDRTLSHFGRLLDKVDVAPFLQEIEAAPQNWTINASRKSIAVQQNTDTILLRATQFIHPVAARSVELVMDIQDSAETQLAMQYPQLMSFLAAFSNTLGKGTLSRAMIVRLTPKMQVGRHWDRGYYYLCRDRYHLVLRSSGSKMECGGVGSAWNVGELWWFNNNLGHSARNEGDDWRIHVIFDVLPHRNAALVEQFKRHTEYYQNAEMLELQRV